MLLDGIVQQAGVAGLSELGFEAAFDKEVGLGSPGGVVLVKAANVVVFREAELGLGETV